MMGDINSQIGGCLMGRDSVAELVDRYGVATFRGAIDTIWRPVRGRGARRDPRHPGRHLHRRSDARRRRAQSRLAALQGDGDRRRRRDDHRPVAAAGRGRRADELGPQRRRLDRGAARLPLSAAAGGRRQRGHVPPAEADPARGHHRQRRPTAPMGSYNSALPTLDRSGDPRARPGGARPGRRRALRHVLDARPTPAAIRRPALLWQCHDSGFGGWGALCDMDGPGPFRTMCHGDTRLIPIEVHEASYPFMIESFSLRTDSGGPGQFPRRARARAPLSDAGAVPHLDADRAHALPGLGH